MFTSYTTAWAKKPCQLPFQCFWAGQQHKALKGPSATPRPKPYWLTGTDYRHMHRCRENAYYSILILSNYKAISSPETFTPKVLIHLEWVPHLDTPQQLSCITSDIIISSMLLCMATATSASSTDHASVHRAHEVTCGDSQRAVSWSCLCSPWCSGWPCLMDWCAVWSQGRSTQSSHCMATLSTQHQTVFYHWHLTNVWNLQVIHTYLTLWL